MGNLVTIETGAYGYESVVDETGTARMAGLSPGSGIRWARTHGFQVRDDSAEELQPNDTASDRIQHTTTATQETR